MIMKKRRLSSDELIPGLPGLRVGDYWAWAYSDIIENVQRGTYAEFLVGVALGLVDGVRIGYDNFDLTYKGKRLEVRSSAYLQSWPQAKPSKLNFSVRKRIAWYPEQSAQSPVPLRSADCFVFCSYLETDAAKANVLDASAWEFVVALAATIDERFSDKAALNDALLKTLGRPVRWEALRGRVDEMIAS